MSQNNSKQIFDEMVMAGFNGVKRIMEAEDLQDSLTAEDAQKVGEGVGKLMVNWVEFVKMASRGKHS